MDETSYLEGKLRVALTECARLQKENYELRKLLNLSEATSSELPPGQIEIPSSPVVGRTASVTHASSQEAKIALFRSLFRGRVDVYPVRWEDKKGRSGYSPACAHEWDRGICGKPRVKCADCERRSFRPVTEQVVRDHLLGKHTIGVYPLLPDETCWFLAADFDKKTWQKDSAAFWVTCQELGVPGALERSRSGQGAHVWIFFREPLPAALARNLGCAILTKTMERRHQIGLDPYDRFFPSQDTMPKGGFGNLIALPLQRGPRDKGSSIFLDQYLRPYQDQWAFLSTVRPVARELVEGVVQQTAKSGGVLRIRPASYDGDTEDDPWTQPPSGRKYEERIDGSLPERVNLTTANLLYVDKAGLPSALLTRLIRLAAFQNPEFYRAQVMRLNTFGKPRVISCAEEFPRYLGLPRGCLEEVIGLLSALGIEAEINDQRLAGSPLEFDFHGSLSPDQAEAGRMILGHDHGVLTAPTAFGKTVIAAWIIAQRKVNTLVMVHRRQLLDQWRERLATFLELPPKEIGQIGAGKSKRTDSLDIALLQSLNRKGQILDAVAEYGQVIVDECHHLSAFTFEQVLRKVKAKYVLGLTATPVRKDGHHPIILMQCGPIRFKVDARKAAAESPFEHLVIPRHTEFRVEDHLAQAGIQAIYSALAQNDKRNELIFDDLLKALEVGRCPLLLTERTDHLEYFAQRLAGFTKNVIVLRGGMGKKQRAAVADRIKAIPDRDERVILATGRYIGEGFDDSRLDTLFLAMPISWRGTLQQYVGRLHRLRQGKSEVQVYDYVDDQVPVLMRMYQKRLKGYAAMGYQLQGPVLTAVREPGPSSI